jgi:hypothetical protein
LNLVDVFRCSADVEDHPQKLQISIDPVANQYIDEMIRGAGFTNPGPLIAVQAGASQAKRQWSPARFIEMVTMLDKEHHARVILTGSPRELDIVNPILQGCGSPNVFSAVGKTSIPQLAALLSKCAVLVTGDTGPMHISVAAGTPVVSMFLASAYGFETGPYSAGNLVLQPVIGCGPCNPNKACSKPDCHETISPRLVAELAIQRSKGEVTHVSHELADPRHVVVYRSVFDSLGFCDLVPINTAAGDFFTRHRTAYRKLWLSDLGGLPVDSREQISSKRRPSVLEVVDSGLEGLSEIAQCAEKGQQLIGHLKDLIVDVKAPAARLSQVNVDLAELDRKIEELGFHFSAFGPLARMFLFAKENLKGSDALDLASQMDSIYRDLGRRCERFEVFYREG